MKTSRRMRMGIAGIHIESSTFSPLHSRKEDFLATRGEEMLSRYPYLDEPEFSRIDPVPLAHFRALPGGQVGRACYESMKAEIIEALIAAAPLDSFYFDVHGAMSVEGLADAEADLLSAIRKVIGPSIPVTCSQDLHGNVSDEVVAMVDFITAYRTAPHVDWMETRERAVRMLLRWWAHPQPIHRARVGIPVLVSGEMSSTTTEPGRSLYAPLGEESAKPGVWDASLWVGYAWADQPRAMASVVVTGTDPGTVKSTALGIAQRYWDARRDFHFISPAGAAEWGLDQALALGVPAVFLSDAGDNPTAGAAGDVTSTLRALLMHPAFSSGATAIFASIPDEAAILVCAEAAVGSEVILDLGGKLDPLHGKPLRVHGVLENFTTGDSMAGRQAVIRIGGTHVIVTERRKPFHKREDFLSLNLDPLEETVTIVKIGYLEPELRAMASHHLLVLSPGAVPPLLAAVGYRSLKRPVFPMDGDFDWFPSASCFLSTPGT